MPRSHSAGASGYASPMNEGESRCRQNILGGINVRESFMDYVHSFDHNDPEYYTPPQRYIREIDLDELDKITEDFNSRVIEIIG